MPLIKMLLTLIVTILWAASRAHSVTRLSRFVNHYEPLNYNTAINVQEQHHRSKRSLDNQFVNIEFHAHGKHFPLRLRRDSSIFAPDLVVEHNSQRLPNFDLSHIVSGNVWGEAGSSVYGSIRDGVFDGKISTPSGNYYVERSSRYFKPHVTSTDFHSVIYSENDIVHRPAKSDQHGHHDHGAAAGWMIQDWMNSIQQSAVETIKVNPKVFHADAVKARGKRGMSYRRACMLHIQTDPLLWEHVHVEGDDETKTREEIASLIAQHVKAVNVIYESEDFGGYRGITFGIQRITINDTKTCGTVNGEQTNPFCSRNIDIRDFLDLHSRVNHDHFCLAYVFTYRDFSGGMLGLAWTASPQGASGGICEKYKVYTENVKGHYIQTKRSLNTGIITFVNHGSRVPPRVSQLNLAHEIGHSFGSPHDWPQDCRPGGKTGNFIMFAGATSGDRPNNSRFSVCSLRNITSVLDAVFQCKRPGKENCFSDEDGPFCGNHIVEVGEECDCGFTEEECIEKCCYPLEISEVDRQANLSAKPCTRRANAVCSPSEGPCCTSDCQFEMIKLCHLDSDCNHQSVCDGSSAQCPIPDPKEDGTECNDDTQVCIKGECIGSICLRYGLQECFLTGAPGVTPEQLCEAACQRPNEPDTCHSSFHQQDANGQNMTGIRLRPGSPCDDFHGYCDQLQKCQAIKGPLARPESQKTLTTIGLPRQMTNITSNAGIQGRLKVWAEWARAQGRDILGRPNLSYWLKIILKIPNLF